MSKKLKKLLLKIGTILMLSISLLSPTVFGKAGDTSNKTILLDYAHMDTISDVGASYKGYTEREIVNEITSRVGDKLTQRGFSVVYTRDRNKPISISGRQQIAWNTEYDYYISIHANSSSSGKGTGTEGFYRGSGKQLTENVCKAISSQIGLEYRRVEESPYYNRKIQDSSLIELGFINNEYDLQKLLNEKDKYVDIIVNAIEQEYNNTIQDKVKVNMGDGTYIYSSYATKDTTIRIVK